MNQIDNKTLNLRDFDLVFFLEFQIYPSVHMIPTLTIVIGIKIDNNY